MIMMNRVTKTAVDMTLNYYAITISTHFVTQQFVRPYYANSLTRYVL